MVTNNLFYIVTRDGTVLEHLPDDTWVVVEKVRNGNLVMGVWLRTGKKRSRRKWFAISHLVKRGFRL